MRTPPLQLCAAAADAHSANRKYREFQRFRRKQRQSQQVTDIKRVSLPPGSLNKASAGIADAIRISWALYSYTCPMVNGVRKRQLSAIGPFQRRKNHPSTSVSARGDC